jgi:hypothetical protein
MAGNVEGHQRIPEEGNLLPTRIGEHLFGADSKSGIFRA